MTDWVSIDKKRTKFEKIYARKALTALRKTIMPFIELTKSSNAEFIDLDMIITDVHIKNFYEDLFLNVGKYFIGYMTDVIIKKDLREDLWEIEMLRYIEEIAGSRITDITNYTKETIMDAIKRAFDDGRKNGISTGEIMKNLRRDITKGKYSDFTKARALRISRTEVMTAANTGSFNAASLSGYVTEKTWLTAPVGTAKQERHNKIGINGVTVRLNEYFDVDGAKMKYPGDPEGGAGNVINCNCTLTFGTA